MPPLHALAAPPLLDVSYMRRRLLEWRIRHRRTGRRINNPRRWRLGRWTLRLRRWTPHQRKKGRRHHGTRRILPRLRWPPSKSRLRRIGRRIQGIEHVPVQLPEHSRMLPVHSNVPLPKAVTLFTARRSLGWRAQGQVSACTRRHLGDDASHCARDVPRRQTPRQGWVVPPPCHQGAFLPQPGVLPPPHGAYIGHRGVVGSVAVTTGLSGYTTFLRYRGVDGKGSTPHADPERMSLPAWFTR